MNEHRNRSKGGHQTGQMVMVRKHGARGVEDVAWGTVVGGGPGKPEVRVEGCVPDPFTGKGAYEVGDIKEFRRSDGFAVSPTRRPVT